MSELLGRPVSFIPYSDGDSASIPIANLPEGVIGLLENPIGLSGSLQEGSRMAGLENEERIEQSATRFAAVFHSVLPEEIGFHCSCAL